MKKDFERRGKEMAKAKQDQRKAFEKERADFDKKIERILDKKQYAQYKLDKQKRFEKKGSFKGKRDQRDPRFKA
jgi:hypothetical protein